MAKLSETFTVGGDYSAPAKKKLSETFSLNNDYSAPKKAKYTATPDNVIDDIPSLKSEEKVIRNYESTPDYNIFERMVNPLKRDIYNEKQKIQSDYEVAKDNQVRGWLKDNGLTAKDVVGMTAYDDYKIKQMLKSKGFDDEQIKAIRNYSDRQLQNVNMQTVEDFAENHKVAGTLLSVPTNLIGGVDTAIEGGLNYLAGKPISTTTNANFVSDVTDTLRDKASENMGVVGKTLYGAGTSVADMGLAALTGGAYVMGLEKAGSVMRDATERGLNPTQIVAEGIASGVTTAITEGKVFDNLGEALTKGLTLNGGENAVKTIIKQIGKTALMEGGQEVAEGTLDILADQIIANLMSDENKSTLNNEYQAYLNSGLDKNEAIKNVIEDTVKQGAMDFIGGALAGGAMKGGALAVGSINNANANRQANAEAEAEAESKMRQAQETADNLAFERMLEQRRQNTEEGFNDILNQQRERLNQEDIARQNEAIANRIEEERRANQQTDLGSLLETASNTETTNPLTDTLLIPPTQKGKTFSTNNDVYVKRFDDANAESTGRPQGLYVSNASTPSPHNDEGSSSSTYKIRQGAKFYDTIFNDKLNSPSRSNIPVEAGTTINYLVDTWGLNNVEQLLSLKKKDAVAVCSNMYPNVDWNRFYDTHEIAEALGGIIARENGIDVVRSVDEDYKNNLGIFDNNEDFTEMSILNDDYIEDYKDDSQTVESGDIDIDALLDLPVLGMPSRADYVNSLNPYDRIGFPFEGEAHTDNEVDNINAYRNFVADDVKTWIDRTRNGEKSMKYKEVAKENDIVADIVENELGIDIHGNSIGFSKDGSLGHIAKNHESGRKDKSSITDDELSRIGYVVSNPDEVAITNRTTSTNKKADNTYSPVIVMRKRIDGHYYVVEAISDAKKKQDIIVSAFVEEVGNETPKYKELFENAYRVADAAEMSAPSPNVRNEHENSALKNDSSMFNIPQNIQNVNSIPSVMAEDIGINPNTNEEIPTVEEIPAVNPGPTQPTEEQPSFRVDSNRLKESEYYTNTSASKDFYGMAKEAQDALMNERIKGNTLRNSVTEAESLEYARNMYENNPDAVRDVIENAPEISNAQIDASAFLINDLISQGNYAEALRYSNLMASKVHDAAQGLQALAKYTRSATGIITKTASLCQLYGEELNMSDEDMARIKQIEDEAKQFNPNSKQASDLYEEAYAIAAKYLPDSTFMEKWNAWRYLSMLGNPRTHIRNMLGNTIFGTVTNVKDAVGSAIESVALRNGQERTKAVVSKVADRDLFEGARKYYLDNAYGIATADGDKYSMRNEIQRQKDVFKSKLLNKANRTNSNLLEKEDNNAIQRKYERALAGYIKANGYDASIFNSQNQNDIDFLKRASDYAVNEAKVATFHEDNAAANLLNEWSKAAERNPNKVAKTLGYVVEALVPFKKTPANVLKQGVQYSPLGLLNVFNNIKNQEGANAVIDSASKVLTGSMILALGSLLASKGIIKGGIDDDDELLGDQEYSLNIGDHSYTIDWMAPAALPLFVGAEMYNASEGDGTFFDSLLSVSEPIIEMSMLQGLKTTLNSVANAFGGNGKDNKLADLAIGIGSGYLSQGVPTALGQVARTIDPMRRSIYTKNDGALGSLEYQGEKLQNKIPFLSMQNEPYVDAFGEEQRNTGNNLLGRAVMNMVSPGYYSNTSRTPLQSELESLGTDEKSLMPDKVKRKIDGQKLTASEWHDYQIDNGQNFQRFSNAVINNPNYNSLSDEEKRTILSDISKFSGAVTKAEDFGYAIDESTSYKKNYGIYKDKGLDGLANYLIFDQKINSLKDGAKGNNAILDALDSLNATDYEKGEYLYDKLSEPFKAAQSAYDMWGPEGLYLAYQIKRNSDADGNGSMKKDELIDYLRTSEYGVDDRYALFNLFYPTSKEIPSLE